MLLNFFDTFKHHIKTAAASLLSLKRQVVVTGIRGEPHGEETFNFSRRSCLPLLWQKVSSVPCRVIW